MADRLDRSRSKIAAETSTQRPSGDWRLPFLAVLRREGNVREACRAAGVSRQVAYRRRNQDSEFRAAWDEARDEAIDQLEEVAFERARRASDTLLIFLLKSHRPTVYRPGPQREMLVRNAEHSARVDQLEAQLREQYGSRGVVFERLCRQLAEVSVTLDLLAERGGDVALQTYSKLHELQVDIINQLRRHEESADADNVSDEARELTIAALRVIENVVAPAAPQLWQQAVKALRRKLIVPSPDGLAPVPKGCGALPEASDLS